MEYLTAPEIAKVFGVSQDTVRRLIDAGELPSIRFTDDGWRRVKRSDVEAYAQQKGIELSWQSLK